MEITFEYRPRKVLGKKGRAVADEFVNFLNALTLSDYGKG